MSYMNEVEENNGSEQRAEEVVEFVNFPDTAFEITRALAIDSGIMFEPMRFEPMPMDWEPVQLNETAVARKPEIVFEVVASPCPGKPLRLPAQCHGYCQQSSYDVLSKDVEGSLCSLAQFDFSYDAAACLWRGKSILGARCLEVLVSCYWDAKKADHLLSVTKVAGDMYQLSPLDVFQQLQSSLRLVVPGASVEGSSSSVRPAPVGPPALRRSGAGGAPMVPPSLKRSNPATIVSNCTNSLQQIVNMLHGQQIDVHTEAARMFYDLVAAHPSPDSEQERLIAEIVVLLLDAAQELDEELQVVTHQCVVLALQTIAERSVSPSIFSPFVVSFLWKVILVDDVDAAKNYVTIAIRRKAVQTLATVLARSPVLSTVAFPRETVARLRDVKLQQLCLQQLLPLCK